MTVTVHRVNGDEVMVKIKVAHAEARECLAVNEARNLASRLLDICDAIDLAGQETQPGRMSPGQRETAKRAAYSCLMEVSHEITKDCGVTASVEQAEKLHHGAAALYLINKLPDDLLI